MITAVRLRLRDPEHYDAEGNMVLDVQWLEWKSVPLVLDGTCTHEETVCSECAPGWANDWEVHPDDLRDLKQFAGMEE